MSSVPLAAVVLAHADAVQVRRLVAALEDVPVVLHCDSKAPDDVAGAMLQGHGSRVQALPRSSGKLSSWSLVRIELAGLRAALRMSSAEHIAVLSGADYPLVGMTELLQRLEPWRGRSYLMSVPIPFADWSVPRHPDGGLWRSQHHFWTRGDDIITVRGIPARFPWRRPRPEGLRLRASSQWKVYGREDAVRLLATLERHPELVRFWRSTFVPDESAVASVLSSPRYAGEPALPDCHGVPWYLDWDTPGSHHPAWLEMRHFDALAKARHAVPGDPDLLARPDQGHVQALFARKFSTAVSAELLDRVDAELR